MPRRPRQNGGHLLRRGAGADRLLLKLARIALVARGPARYRHLIDISSTIRRTLQQLSSETTSANRLCSRILATRK